MQTQKCQQFTPNNSLWNLIRQPFWDVLHVLIILAWPQCNELCYYHKVPQDFKILFFSREHLLLLVANLDFISFGNLKRGCQTRTDSQDDRHAEHSDTYLIAWVVFVWVSSHRRHTSDFVLCLDGMTWRSDHIIADSYHTLCACGTATDKVKIDSLYLVSVWSVSLYGYTYLQLSELFMHYRYIQHNNRLHWEQQLGDMLEVLAVSEWNRAQ